MITVDYEEVCSQLPGNAKNYSMRSLNGGLIHSSFEVSSDDDEKYFLQRINSHVFPDADLLVKNYLGMVSHAREQDETFRMPTPLGFRNGKYIITDNDGNKWRLFSFIEGAYSRESPQNPAEAAAVASLFAQFQVVFGNMSPNDLSPALPGFHDLGVRFDAFMKAVNKAGDKRLLEAEMVIKALEKRNRYVELFQELTRDSIPTRIMHHDAKMSNVLFEKDGSIQCVVDFDTAMPGYIFSDLGDLVRSMACVAGENENLPSRDIRKSYYDAIVGAYLERMGPYLTKSERKYIHFSGLMMTFMQALRFLTDYLTGDHYYKVSHPTHNLERARNQVVLLENLETFLEGEYQFTI